MFFLLIKKLHSGWISQVETSPTLGSIDTSEFQVLYMATYKMAVEGPGGKRMQMTILVLNPNV